MHILSRFALLFYCTVTACINHAITAQDQFNNDILDVIARIPDGDRNRQLRALTGIENRTRAGESIENTNMTGVTNLARELATGHVAAALFLIERGANIDTQTIFGTNMLHAAAIHPANEHIAQFLINYGVDVNQMDSGFDITPLFIAVLFGNEKLVHCLVENGADVNAKLAVLAITPLHLAVQLRRREISQYLIEHGAQINAELSIAQITPLLLLKLRIQHAMQPGTSALMMLVNSRDANSQALEKYLVAHGGTSSFDELVPLVLELLTFYNTTTKLDQYPTLFAPKMREGLCHLTQLHIAAAQGSPESVKSLLLGGADVNARDTVVKLTPLFFAVITGNISTIRLLLEYGAAIDQPTEMFGINPLLFACGQKNIALAQFLLEQGANPNVTMAGGLTPLHLAVDNGSQELANLLRAHGADTGIRDWQGKTALEYLQTRQITVHIERK